MKVTCDVTIKQAIDSIDPKLHDAVAFGLSYLRPSSLEGFSVEEILTDPGLLLTVVRYWITEYPDEFKNEGILNLRRLKRLLLLMKGD